MSTRAPWFQCYASDLLGTVSAMDPDSICVYTILLLRIYEDDGPVADDARVLANRSNLSFKRTTAALEWLIGRGFIARLDSGKYDIPTTHAELARREKRINNAQSAGNESARKRLLDQRCDSTLVQRPSNYIDSDIDSESESRKRESKKRAPEGWALCSEAFERFWAAYPHKVGKPAAAQKFSRVWKEEESILVGLRRYISSRRPEQPWLNPATFLNQRRWEDAPAAMGTPANAIAPSQRKFADASMIRTPM